MADGEWRMVKKSDADPALFSWDGISNAAIHEWFLGRSPVRFRHSPIGNRHSPLIQSFLFSPV
jgi:hypothetical protein